MWPVHRELCDATVRPMDASPHARSEEHTSELQSQSNLVCRLLLEKKIDHLLERDANSSSVLDVCHVIPVISTTSEREQPARSLARTAHWCVDIRLPVEVPVLPIA